MPTCCNGKLKRPRIHIYRSGQSKTYYAIVGADMLTGYTDKESLKEDAKASQAGQLQFRCGHIVRLGDYSPIGVNP